MEFIKSLPQAMIEPMQALMTKLLEFAPNMIAALLMLIVGYLVAKFIGFLLSRVFSKIGINKLSDKVGVSAVLGKAGIEKNLSDLLGAVVFWIVMLTFLVSASEALGLERVSATVDDFVLYLPKVIGASVILLIGLFVSNFVRNGIRTGATAIGADYAAVLSKAAYGFLVVISVVLAISQLDIDVTLLNRILQILLLTIAVAVMLSMGLGTREISANVMAGIYLRDLYKSGAKIEVDGVKGTVAQVGTTKSVIDDGKSLISFPNQHLLNAVVKVQK